MTSAERRFYLVLHTVRELAAGMIETGGLLKKSKNSLERIVTRTTLEMQTLGAVTPADVRHFARVAARLRTTWEGEEEAMSRTAFISIGLALVVDHRGRLPQGATHAREACEALEGMLSTLYQHFDPDLADLAAMNLGEATARDFQTVTLAA